MPHRFYKYTDSEKECRREVSVDISKVACHATYARSAIAAACLRYGIAK